MAGEHDFLDLYRKLGVEPDTDLGTFRQAYRRRVALLHPDRRAGNGVDRRAALLLQKLTAQYDAAMAFHRMHGRMPGAPAVRNLPSARGAFTPTLPAVVVAPRRPWHARAQFWLSAAAIAVLLWTAIPALLRTDPAPDAVDNIDDAPAADTLAAGMTPTQVRQIEGDPASVHGDRWLYGRSWIRFEHARVSDWYSAPQQPLRTAGAMSASIAR